MFLTNFNIYMLIPCNGLPYDITHQTRFPESRSDLSAADTKLCRYVNCGACNANLIKQLNNILKSLHQNSLLRIIIRKHSWLNFLHYFLCAHWMLLFDMQVMYPLYNAIPMHSRALHGWAWNEFLETDNCLWTNFLTGKFDYQILYDYHQTKLFNVLNPQDMLTHERVYVIRVYIT